MTDQPKAEIERKLDTPVDEAPLTFKMIQSIAATSMVPAAYRGKPMEIVAAVLTGRELGLPPFEAMRSIDVIDGKPNLSAELTLRLLREKGHKVKVVEAGPERVSLKGIRAEDPDDEMTVTYTWEEASRVVTKYKMKQGQNGRWFPVRDENGQKIPEAYLTDKDNWRNYPTDMLYWRCLTRLARWLFPDAIGATRLVYTPEELSPNLADYTPPASGEGELRFNGGWEVVDDDDDDLVEAEIVEAVNEFAVDQSDGITGTADEKPQDHEDVVDADVERTPGSIDSDVNEGPIRGESDVPADDPFDMSGANPANPADRAAATAPVDVDPPSDDELDQAWSVVYATLGNPGEIVAGNMDQVRTRVRNLFAGMATVGLWPDTGSGRAIELACLKHFGTRHVSELRRDQLDEFARVSVDAAAKVVEDHGRQDQLSV